MTPGVVAAVARIRSEPLGAAPAFPPEAADLTIGDIGERGWRVHEHLSTPVAVLDEAALEHNLATMAAWCAARGVELQPHGKTTMSPQVFARQLAHGASGIVAATPAQVRTMRAFGVERVALANQLTQPREAEWVARELARDPGFAFSCWVDSPAGVEIVERAGAAAGEAVDVLLEVGQPGGRTGCRTDVECAAVAAEADRSPHVRLVGVAGYEGSVAADRCPASMAAVRWFLSRMRTVADGLAAAGRLDGDGPWTLTAGGSMFFDVVVDELAGGTDDDPFRVVLRSGCYVAHDHGMFAANTPSASWAAPLRPALTVWGTVLSVADGTAFLDVGRRDVSYDQGLPIPLRRLRPGDGEDAVPVEASVRALNDQHAFVRLAAHAEVRVGDRLELGVSHPCTTFDKHRLIPVTGVDGAIVDVVRTFF